MLCVREQAGRLCSASWLSVERRAAQDIVHHLPGQQPEHGEVERIAVAGGADGAVDLRGGIARRKMPEHEGADAGAARELVELILRAQGSWDAVVSSYEHEPAGGSPRK